MSGRGYGQYTITNRFSRNRPNPGLNHDDRPSVEFGEAMDEAALHILRRNRQLRQPPPQEDGPFKRQKVRFEHQGGGHHHSDGRRGPPGSRHFNQGIPLRGSPVFKTPGDSGESKYTEPAGAYKVYLDSLNPTDFSLNYAKLRGLEKSTLRGAVVCKQHLTNADGCDGLDGCDGHHDTSIRNHRKEQICPQLKAEGRCRQGGYLGHIGFFHPMVDRSKHHCRDTSRGSTTVHLSNPQRDIKPSYGLELSGDADWDARHAARHSELVSSILESEAFVALKSAYIDAVDTSLSPAAQCNKLLEARWQHRRRLETRFGLRHIYADIPTEVALPDHIWLNANGDPRLPDEVQKVLLRNVWSSPFEGYPYGPDSLFPYHPFENLLNSNPFLLDGSINPDVAELLPYGPSLAQAQAFLKAADKNIKSINTETTSARNRFNTLEPLIKRLQTALAADPPPLASDPRHKELADKLKSQSSATSVLERLASSLVTAKAAKAKALAAIKKEHKRIADLSAAAPEEAIAVHTADTPGATIPMDES